MFDTTILICSRDSGDLVFSTLYSVAQQTYSCPVVFLDDGNVPATYSRHFLKALDWLEYKGFPVIYKRNVRHQGVAFARREAFVHCHTPWALSMDDDMILEKPTDLARLVRQIKKVKGGFITAVLPEINGEDWDQYWRIDVPSEFHLLENAPAYERQCSPFGFYSDEGLKPLESCPMGCVLFDAEYLKAHGGFEFYKRLIPSGNGEEIYATRILAKKGGYIDTGVRSWHFGGDRKRWQNDLWEFREIAVKQLMREDGHV